MYRIFPALWEGIGCSGTATVYAIDRAPPTGTFPVGCSARPKEDPASTWEASTFTRLLWPPDIPNPLPTNPNSYCCVLWGQLPAWISWIGTLGYSLAPNTKLSPNRDFYIIGP